MKRRKFIKATGAGALFGMMPWTLSLKKQNKTLRVAQVGLGMMGTADLAAMAAHPAVEVVALCDVDSNKLNKAAEGYPKARKFVNYREMLNTMGHQIDAVVVSTPDHNHAPISLMAMEMDKNVYCANGF